MGLRTLARDLGVAARLGGRVLRRRMLGADGGEDEAVLPGWQPGLEARLRSLPAEAVVQHRFIELPGTQPSWTESGVVVAPGAGPRRS